MNANEIKDSLKETGATLHTAFDSAARDLRRLKNVAEDKIEETRHTIRTSPLAAVAMVATAGIIFGFAAGWATATVRRK